MPPTVAIVYLALGVGVLFWVTTLRHPRIFGRFLQPVVGFVAMGPALGLPQLLVAGALVTAVVAALGGLGPRLGWVGLALHLAAWMELLAYGLAVQRSLPRLDGEPVADEDSTWGTPPLKVRWTPFLTWWVGGDVRVTRDVPYHEVDGVRLKADIYQPGTPVPPRPPIVYVHGGGWIRGSRRHARFLARGLADAGWTVFAVSYRKAPRFPLPAAIHDVKAGLAWVRAHATEWGALDAPPLMIGGSAGGHLTALAALTPHRPDLQPGFEGADTTVAGAVICYGVTDLEHAFEGGRNLPTAWFVERVVVRQRRLDVPETFAGLNPIKQRPPVLPPLLLVHGDRDDLVSPRLSSRFVGALREAGATELHLLEVPEAPHAFDLVPSPLHQRAMRLILAFFARVAAPPEAERSA